LAVSIQPILPLWESNEQLYLVLNKTQQLFVLPVCACIVRRGTTYGLHTFRSFSLCCCPLRLRQIGDQPIKAKNI